MAASFEILQARQKSLPQLHNCLKTCQCSLFVSASSDLKILEVLGWKAVTTRCAQKLLIQLKQGLKSFAKSIHLQNLVISKSTLDIK